MNKFPLWAIVIVVFLGCSRENRTNSKLFIKTPSKGALLSKYKIEQSFGALSLAEYKVCYGVNVVGPGIAQQNSVCGPSKGIYSGFVKEGDTLAVTVPSGNSRNISVYTYITPRINETCPQWNFNCSKGQECQIYKVGEVIGLDINGPEVTVAVNIQFPGFDKSVVVNSSSPYMCTGEVKNQLFTTGDVRDPSGNPISENISHPTSESLFKIDDWLYSASSLNRVLQEPLYKIPPFLHSITSDPSTGKIYGLSASGRILEVNPSTGQLTTFTETTCPLSYCRAPRWFQSISIGLASQVFGLDHGGNIWKLDSAGVLKKTPNQVGRNVQQVVFF